MTRALLRSLFFRGLAGTALLTLCAVSQAQAPEQVTWGWFNAAPYMIPEGADAGQGIFDQARKVLKTQLPDYVHTDIVAPFPRIVDEIKKGSPWCFAGGVKTPEREEFAYFSQPIALFLPFQIVLHKGGKIQSTHKTQPTGPQSLESLLTQPSLQTSVLRGRSVSPAIDALLHQHPPAQTHSDFKAALQMLLADRLDYLIEMPVITAYQSRQMGQPDSLVYLPIQEGAEVVLNRVMCPKTPWGRKLIDDINGVLKRERMKPHYRQLVEKWSDPSSVKQIRGLYDTLFLNTP